MPDGLIVDFLTGATGYRRRHSFGRRQPLPRALGMHRKDADPNRFHIIDATAGLGRDAFLLASLGTHVTLLERNLTMFRLLQQAMARARAHDAQTAAIMDRMHLVHADARHYLSSRNPEYVYLDPMHPQRTGSALVKKQLRQVRDLVGTDPDSGDLLRSALQVATKRVVLKWPLRAPAPPGIPAPSHQICGKTVRYDVFVRHRT